MDKKDKKYFEEYIYSERDFLIKTEKSLFPYIAADKREDFVEETLYKASENLDKFDRQNVRGWLTTILKNVTKNGLRQSVYTPDTIMSIEQENNGDWLQSAEMVDSPEDVLIDSEIDPKLKLALSEMKPKLKDVFRLRVFGYKYDEIAKKLDIQPGTVMSRMNRARAFLKKYLDSDTATPGDV